MTIDHTTNDLAILLFQFEANEHTQSDRNDKLYQCTMKNGGDEQLNMFRVTCSAIKTNAQQFPEQTKSAH